MAAMSRRGVDCRPFFHPLSSLPAYAHLPHAAACAAENVVSYSLAPRAVNVPSGFDLDEERVTLVCRRLREAIAELSG
jgi:perosamine synthetase